MKITIQDNKTSVTVQPRDFKVTISGSRGPAGPSEWGGIDGDIEDQTDLYNALQARVPYTGATADVNLGEYGAQLGNLEFDNTPANVPTTAGSVYWSDTDGTLNMVLKGGQTISRIGETQHIRALNNTGSQIARGKVVYVVGAQGQRLTIALADADTEILSKDTIGFTSEAIADGAEGFVIVQGVVNNISTTGMTDGATVYLSQTAGSYTTTPPPDPAHLVILGFIVNGGSGGAGSIYVKVDNGYELEELHNVSNSAKSTPVGDDALFLRDSADNNLWKRLTWTNALAGVKTHMDTFKSVAGGYASLDGSGKVPSSELPSYVDDVVEVANYAALPVTGETGKIYVTLDTNKCYRWSGTVYVQVAQGFDTLTTTGTSGAATLVGSTLNIPQYQSVLTNPVTGTGAAGQVAYFSGTSAVTGSANLIFDGARLGLNRTTSLVRRFEMQQANGSVAAAFGIYDFGGSLLSVMGVDTVSTNDYQFASTTGIRFYAGSVIGNVVTMPTNERMRITLGGNVLINNTDGTGRLTVRGSGTTSSTTALLVQNSAPTDIFYIQDDGVVRSLNGFISIDGSTQLNSLPASTNGNFNGISISRTQTPTTGQRNGIRLAASLTTTGSTECNQILILPTINQTGGANGITRGLYVNPTLTAAADWRSVEFSNNTGWGLYGAGTANNYLGGSLGIGTNAPAERLSIQTTTSGATTNIIHAYSNSGAQSAFRVTELGNGIFRNYSSIGSLVNNGYGAVGSNYYMDGGSTRRTNGDSVSAIDFLSGGFRFVTAGNGSANSLISFTTVATIAQGGDMGLGISTTFPSARLHVRGSGTTSSTTALLVQNSTPAAIMACLDSRTTWFGSSTGYDGTIEVNLAGHASRLMKIGPFEITQGAGANWTGQGIQVDGANRTFIFNISNGNTTDLSAFTFNGGNVTAGAGFSSRTSGTINWLLTNNAGFAPTSGTAVFNQFALQGTINQTGGANGITRGLYVNPTLTSAADWRSVEWSNNTGWGLYGAGTANNYLGGGLGIGTTSLTNYALRIGKSIAGNISSVGFGITSTISSAVTSSASLYLSLPSTQAASFTLSQIRHFEAGFFTLGEGSSITNQYGFFCGNLTQATNNYGFYGDIASGTGRWNLYMNGTAANYLAGNTSIGTTTSSGRLTVRGSGTTSATNGLLIEDSGGTDTFTIRDDGGYAFKGGTVGLAQTGYTTFTNLTTDRTCDANATTVEELADILGTLIEDLKTKGIISA